MAEESDDRKKEEEGRKDRQASGEERDDDDSQEVHRRLEPYGISEEQLYPEDLVVLPGKRLHVTAARQRKTQGFVELRPQSIDDVKRWIGVPDEIGRQRQCATQCVESFSMTADPEALRSLRGGRLRGLHRLADTYVYGDSAQVAQQRHLLDGLLLDAWIIGLFVRRDIDVYGLLELGPDVRLLWARHIRIWPHGELRILGNTKVDCVSVEGIQRRFIAPTHLAEYMPKVGFLSALEDGDA